MTIRQGARKFLKIQVNHLFLPLVVVLVVLVLIFRGHSLIQFELVTLGVILYVSTALLHHHFDKSLTVEVILEYILIAALVLIILQGLLA